MLSCFINMCRTVVKERPVIGYYGFWVILTYLGVITAVFGIRFALEGNIRYALICLMIAGICDTFDGRVASLKKRTDREKNFGIQIDALADIISFGVLPAVIGYYMSQINHLTPSSGFFGVINTIVLSMYLLTALIRLAYFNVIEAELQNKNEKRTYYEGLPVTSVALIIPFLYSVFDIFNISLAAVYNILLVFISVLFVLKIKIPKPRGRSQLILCLIGLPFIIYILLPGGIRIWI